MHQIMDEMNDYTKQTPFDVYSMLFYISIKIYIVYNICYILYIFDILFSLTEPVIFF